MSRRPGANRWGSVLTLAAIVGCTGNPPVASKPPATQDPAASSPPVTVESAVVDLDGENEANQDKATEPVPPKPIPTERLVLFTPDGPLLIDLMLAIGAAAQAEEVVAFGNLLSRALDADADGEPRWEELAESLIGDRLSLLGQQRLNATQAREARRFFDADGDRAIDPSEAIAWLERGGNADVVRLQPSVFGQRAFEPDPRTTPLWRVLDVDADGTLGREEIEASPSRLLARDTDDDLVIVPAELLGLQDLLLRRGQMLGRTSARTNSAAYQAGLFLRQRRDTLDVRDALALLSNRDYLQRSDFGAARPLFDRIDIDADRFLSDDEWAGLAPTEAALACEVSFEDPLTRLKAPTLAAEDSDGLGSTSPNQASPVPANEPRFKVRVGALSFQPSLQLEKPSGGAYSLQLPRGVIDLSASDANVSIDLAFAERLLTLVEESEMQSIEATEFNGIDDRPDELRFELLDFDADGELTRDEVVGYVMLLSGQNRLSVGVTVAAGGDPLFGLLDADRDGRLGEREIRGVPRVLNGLTGADGLLQPREAPWRVRVTIHRGRIAPTPRGSATRLATDSPLPRWFVGADYNSDGVVSRKEHIGDEASFARFDQDEDGFLTAEEITAAENQAPEQPTAPATASSPQD